MKKTIIGGIAATATALGITLAAPAQADELSYLTAVAQAGVVPNDGNYVTALRWGYAICADKQYWLPLDQTISNVYYNRQNSLTWDQTRAVVIAAQVYLC